MKRIMIDPDKCRGCKSCSLACMQAHRAQPGTLYDLDLTDPANETRNYILTNQQKEYRPLFCRHCEDAPCVTACMSGAMRRDAESFQVLYDLEQCAACYMCVMECPYGVLKPQRQGQQKIVKCDFCVGQDLQPQCVQACPTKAIYLEEV